MPDFTKRNLQIYKERKAGATLKSIGLRYGINSERVRQICAKIERRLQAEHRSRNRGTYLTVCALKHARASLKVNRLFNEHELTESDKILLEKIEALIDVYTEGQSGYN